MKLCILALVSLACARTLGIRYEDVVGTCVDRVLRKAPAVFTIRSGRPVPCKHLGADAIYSPLDMIEGSLDPKTFDGILRPVGSMYSVDGHETQLDAAGINHLCLSTVFEPLYLKRNGVSDVVIACRSYFDEERARMVGEVLSNVLGLRVSVVPEALCSLAWKVNHLENASLPCLTIVMSGRKTVFSLYRVETKDGKKSIENVFHRDLDVVSDVHVQMLIYRHMSKMLQEYISRENVQKEHKKVTLYPRQPGSQRFDLKVDVTSMYREVAKALANGMVVGSVKIKEGMSVVDGDEKTKYVVEAPVFNVDEIQRELSELIKKNRKRIDEAIADVKREIADAVGDASCVVLMRSEFFDNPELKIFDVFGRRDVINPEFVEQGACLVKRGFSVSDPRIVEVKAAEKDTGALFLEEVGLRDDIERILHEKSGKKLKEIFRDVPAASLKDAEKLFGNLKSVDGMRKAVLKWNALVAEEKSIRNSRRERERALNNMREAVATIEELGSKNEEVWNGGLKDEVSKTRELLQSMEKDLTCRKDAIEDAELDLVVKKERMFAEHRRKIEEAKRAEEAKSEKTEEGAEDAKEPENGSEAEIPDSEKPEL